MVEGNVKCQHRTPLEEPSPRWGRASVVRSNESRFDQMDLRPCRNREINTSNWRAEIDHSAQTPLIDARAPRSPVHALIMDLARAVARDTAPPIHGSNLGHTEVLYARFTPSGCNFDKTIGIHPL
jgi:hypothetical protein